VKKHLFFAQNMKKLAQFEKPHDNEKIKTAEVISGYAKIDLQ